MSKVSHAVRVRRLYSAVLNLEKELHDSQLATPEGRYKDMLKYALLDLREAAKRLECASFDLEAAAEGVSA